jgi:hypothetical protein
MGKTPAQKRAAYAKRRLCELRARVPDLPDNALSRTTLRRLSCGARRAGKGTQSTLGHGDTHVNDTHVNDTHVNDTHVNGNAREQW